MRVHFFWSRCTLRADMYPCCNVVADDGSDSLLGMLLVDDGGSPYSAMVGWYEEVLERVAAAEETGAEYDWLRETWEALVRREQVTIRSLYAPEVLEVVSIQVFKEVVAEWLAFLLNAADQQADIKLEF